MAPTNYRDDLIPQDTAQDESSPETGTSLPLSEAELQDPLYGEGRSVDERLAVLRSLRDDLVGRDGGDVGDNDPQPLIADIEGRITELEAEAEAGGGVVFDADPLAHRETLSPDSDELEELEEEDEASLDEEDEWLDDEDETELGKPV